MGETGSILKRPRQPGRIATTGFFPDVGERLLASVLQSVAAHVVVLDPTGIITFASESWYAFGESNGASRRSIGVGQNYLAARRAAGDSEGGGAEASAGIHAVLAGERPSFTLEYSCVLPTGEVWFAMRVDRMPEWHGGVVVVHADGGAVTGARDAVVDVTRTRSHEAALARAHLAVRNLAGRLITAQEAERTRIARELHDDVNQQIAAAAIDASLLRRTLEMDHQLEAAARLEARLGELAGVVRRLSHRMHPPDLRADLADSITTWCAELRRTERLDVRCVTASLQVALPADVALCLYRIAQEALRNVIKHADVGRASLRLSFENERVHLVVSDRGKGFDVPRRRRNGGLGLVSMEERARILGGRFEIRSAPDRGTTVRVSVPVSNA